MCEWLSCTEWCDVQLLCGGRTFRAHKAVLASVSAFLRRVLLSCPDEEAPTIIVLPDFDIEAMSSVIYYVYNGEVVVQKQKLKLFLDIIEVLQIFIDERCLPKALCIVEQKKFIFHPESFILKKGTFSLGSGNLNEQFVKIKKGQQIQELMVQSLSKNSGLGENAIVCQDWPDLHGSYSRNLQWPSEDRNNSLLRDLFMETNPRNGKPNGGAAGVMVIQNERYRGPTSEHLTNANCRHFSADGTDPETTNRTPEHTFFLSQCNSLKASHQNLNSYYEILKRYAQYPSSKSISNDTLKTSEFLNSSTTPPLPRQKEHRQLCVPDEMNTDLNNHSSTQVAGHTSVPLKNSENVNHRAKHKLEGGFVKGAILNQVLQSPWCPRPPNNYRPFRKKIDDNRMSTKNGNVNDDNNNVQKASPPIIPDQKVETISPSETDQKTTITSYSVANLVSADFKCTVCDQVFTSAETLCTHMRRHSSTRYTCGECSKSFSQLRNFKYHMSVHRGTREFAATCSVCGKYFNDRGYLSSHMKIHRNRKEYKCSLCPKSFNQRVAYNMHVRIHTGVKPHVCTECGKAFSRKMLLKQHQRTHSGEKPYACPHCDKRFADRSNMTLHLRLHTGVKPFSCSLCPKSFTKKHHLKSHLNFHTGVKPYSCPHCKLGFTQSSNMRTHMKKCSSLATATEDHATAGS